ncbi:MAG TPA: hypothetical protein VG938_00695, partial [Verrucomicrobiae bacterium]|nr:hypothetical protein [Verrucomicrobiae bacterium]
MTFIPDATLLHEHRKWLERFDPQHLMNWEKLLANDQQAALCESAARRLLLQNGNSVEPNELLDGSRKSPDFRCAQAGKKFFAEVTCISIGKATEYTGLSHLPSTTSGFSFSGFGGLSGAIFRECISKTRQCADLPHPAILVVGTFHWMASYLCFEKRHIELLLTGETTLTQNINPQTGGPVGDDYVSTELKAAAFLRPINGWIDHARNPIAAILACGFGVEQPNVRCAFHPKPVRCFSSEFIPQIECCRLEP